MGLTDILNVERSVPKFSVHGSRYDMGTYAGRLRHFISIIDPRLLFVGHEELAAARDLLNLGGELTKSIAPYPTDSQLWEARRVVDSAVNGATGEIIHPIARMCAFVPSSLPITLGMLTMTSTASILGLQWINQSYNAIFNYSHRSQAGSDSSQILKAYALATGTSCGLALGLSKLASHVKPPWIISTVAVMAAGSANVAFTRANEMTDGVNVTNDKGEVIGKSRTAGKYAVGYTILSRSVFLPIPLMVLPGLMSQAIHKRVFTNSLGKRAKLLLDVGCILLSQAVALPVCIAAFPPTLSLKRSQLEPEFTKIGDANEIVFVQKGV